MATLDYIKAILSKNKQRLTAKYGLSTMAIFGSFARNENTSKSDVDILVEFKKPIGIDFIDLAEELENILGIKVDLVSKNGVKGNYLKAIEQELLYV